MPKSILCYFQTSKSPFLNFCFRGTINASCNIDLCPLITTPGPNFVVESLVKIMQSIFIQKQQRGGGRVQKKF